MFEKSNNQELYDSQFEIIKEFATGVVRRHTLVDINKHDYKYVEEIAFEKAEAGTKIDIMPVLYEYSALRNIIFWDAYFAKNPDLRIDGIFGKLNSLLK